MVHVALNMRDMPRLSMPFPGPVPALRGGPRFPDNVTVETLDLEALLAALTAETKPNGSWSGEGLSKAAGGKRDLVRDLLRGSNKNPSADVVVGLARAMKRDLKEFIKGPAPSPSPPAGSPPTITKKVIGAVAGGVWLEQTQWPEEEQYEVDVPVLHGPEARLERFVVELRGPSMDVTIPPGSILDCIRVPFNNVDYQPGDLVIVERHAHDLTEMTCKRLARGPEGWELHAESTKPRFRDEVIKVGDPDPDQHTDNDVRVIGIVLEARQLHRRRKYA